MKITGQCHCTAVAFEAEANPDNVRICHCTDCQILGGSAFTTNVPVETGSFKLVRGKVNEYIKTAESGNKRAHGFCPTCATRIYSASVNKTPVDYAVRVGAVDQRGELPPKRQIWCSSEMPWVDKINGIARAPKQ
jgi:hypothetical protein